MLHGREAFADRRADGAEDQERREVNVANHGAAQQAAIFVFALNAAESAERFICDSPSISGHFDQLEGLRGGQRKRLD